MGENRIKIKPGQKESSDNKLSTLETRKTKKDKSICPLIEEEVIKNCDSCKLKIICDGIDTAINKVQ